MFCRNCGKEIPDKAVYCVHCGAVTDNPSAFNAQPAAPDKKTNGFAIAGFVLSLVGLVLGYYTYDVVPLLGLIFSIIGLVKSKTCGSGRGLSIAGLVISIVSTVLAIVLIILIVGLAVLPVLGVIFGSGVPN
ncbi:MAG: zinc-ribbon domain-containing protein [Clostridia bacterium]|nr:zinc-ribbon domain-containing protein [Clostridia bacterium]